MSYLLTKKNSSNVLSSVQGSFPILLIKLLDIDTQARGEDWVESIALFIYLPLYKNAKIN